MVETLSNMQHVYAKWEQKNPYRIGSPGGVRPSDLPGKMSQSEYNNMICSGRNAWKSQNKGVNSHLSQKRSYRPKISTPATSLSEMVTTNLASFKSHPTDHPTSRSRPFTGRCCSCLPASRNMFYTDDIPSCGFKNILEVETRHADRGWFTRMFAQYFHVMSLNIRYSYPNVSMAVLTSPRLIEAVNTTVNESLGEIQDETKRETLSKKQRRKIEKRVKSIVKRMQAAISNKLLRFTAWFLHKLLSRLLSSIIVHQGQMELVNRACKRDIPVLFLPSHRSHLDYILITYILVNYHLRAPHVAAGDNLLIPFFGSLMRGLGGYFIRRKLDQSGHKDYVYRAILQSYMDELLRKNQNFEFFVEGGRTRSGKALHPKGGLLSVVVDAFNENVITDAYIIPIGISYDKILDGDFCREQMGEPKVRETFWRACTAIWKVIMSEYGSVRIDFAQPFSLKEYIQVSSKYPNSSQRALQYDSSSCSDSPTTPNSMMKISSSDASIYGISIVVESQRKLIQGLAEHIVYACVGVQSLMSTQLLTHLLLSKHRQGCTLSVLLEDFDWLKDEIVSRGRDLGFTGKTEDVVHHAIRLFGDRLITTKYINRDSGKKSTNPADIFIEPNITLPNVFGLCYYANVSNSPFVLESALVNALYSLIPADKWLGVDSHEPIRVSQQKLIEGAVKICLHLKYEYIYCPPCRTIEEALTDAFDQLTICEILQRQEVDDGYSTSKEQNMARRLDQSLSFGLYEDDSDGEYEEQDTFFLVNQKDAYCVAKLGFLRAVLAPLLETYYVTACNLISLLRDDSPEDDFCHRVHDQLKERVTSGVASYAESASLDTLRNAIRSFQHNNIIRCYQAANIRMLTLSNRYQREPSLLRLIESFEKYRQ